MSKQYTTISVVVPVFNEIGNLPTFHKELVASLDSTTKPYEIIYVDDRSTDGTFEWLKRRQKHAPKNAIVHTSNPLKSLKAVHVLQKQGKRGKAYSLIEGFAVAKGSIFVMIDGDLQYPPKAIPFMITDIANKNADIVVAKRRNYKDNYVRKFLSTGFKHVFGKMLFGLSTDIQSGLKAFSRQTYKTVAFVPSSPWTFDLEFLHRATSAGYKIKNINITFSERLSGTSKIKVARTIGEIGLNALNVRMRKKQHFEIPSEDTKGMTGAGVGYSRKKYITHTTLPFKLSAAETFSTSQKLFIWALLGVIISGLIKTPLSTLQFLVGFLSLLYFIDTVFNFAITLRSLRKREEIQVTQEETKLLDEKTLPVYTILCPLYKEAHVVPQFVKAISQLEWPKEKLDVMLLLEEDDIETVATIQGMDLPSYIRIVVVPDSQPKTKPKACNYGLGFARGEYLVIYDAEDIPDTLQLKKAYLGFQRVPESVKCLQAKLNFYNARQNWLTRFFTAEYSLWFDLTLTGLQSFQSTLPLGGTSNHFKTDNLRDLFGWDPFNVTEDADLGIRLFQKGFRTEILDSTTMEEATSKTKTWIKQRSRWIKGYMQTYLVHMRNITPFIKEKGLLHFLIFQLTVGGKILFVLINPVMWITTIVYFSLYFYTSPFIEAVFAPPLSYLAVCSLVFGNFMFLYSYMIGIGKRSQWDLMKYVFMIPYYWALMSIAAAYALFQLIFKPHYWEKTTHGFHLAKVILPKVEVAKVIQPVATVEDQNRYSVPKYTSPAKRPSLLSTMVGVLLIQIPFAAFFNHTLLELFKALAFLSVVDFIVLFMLFFQKEYFRTIANNIASIMSLFTDPSRAQAWKEKRLRILIFNWRDTKHVYAGGAEVYIHELAKQWVADGNTVTVFCGNDNKNLSNETIDGISIIRRGGTYTVYLFAALYYIFKFRRNHDVIIDCENGIPFFTPLYTRKPVILLIHHIHQDVFRAFLKFPLKQIAGMLEGKLMPLLYWNKRVVTVSQSSLKEIAELGIIRPEQIDVVYNGVKEPDTHAYKKANYPLFTYLGRLKDYKNVDVAIKAFAEVVKKHADAKLLIAGQGESFDGLYALAGSYGLLNNVTFLGRISEDEKTKILAESWVMLQPSQMEGWGISVIEANAHGTPVIASRVNGLKDSVQENVTGLLVEVGNIHAFSEAMNLLIENPALRTQLSYSAHEWSKYFRWSKSAEHFYKVIGRSVSESIFRTAVGNLATTK